MKTWKLTIEYDGTKYHGWQEQINARTVAGTLRAAAEEILETPLELMGAGRTDAGVHALAQVAHLKVHQKHPRLKDWRPQRLERALNERLPSDLVVTAVEDAAPRFHARHDAISRSYLYQISTRKTALNKRQVWWVKPALDASAMSTAATRIAGRHDFVRFAAADPSKPNESTIVVVTDAAIAVDEHYILFRIEASHFLWRMVRRLTGALVKVGVGELAVDDFGRLIDNTASETLDVAAWTAPASGLFLESVLYPGQPRGAT